MASEDKKKSVPAALGLMLLSLGMASLIAIHVSNDASAQGLLEGLEREQGDSGDVQSSCAPTQTGGGGGTFDDGVSVGGTSAYDDYDADVEGGDSITTTGTTTNATRSYYNWRRGKPINIRGKRQHTRSMHSIASWRHSRCPHVLGYGSECIR